MYLFWDEKTITDFSDENIESIYNNGYVLTRVGKGDSRQVRSLRIVLSKFELSSENKRILKKTEDLSLTVSPIPYDTYDWSIHKMGKDFYEQKFGPKTFSAQKIKELITDKEKSNFNRLFVYGMSLRGAASNGDEAIPSFDSADYGIATSPAKEQTPRNDNSLGYCIALETKNILHYCYPFYELLPNRNVPLSNMGMGMMLKAIVWAKENNKQYIYLGSAQRPTDTYKLQFAGLEWFDKQQWQTDTSELKITLQNLK